MEHILTDAQRRLLRMIFDRGAEGASRALSKWLGEEVRLAISDVELAELDRATELLGPSDTLVAACAMGLTGRLTGSLILVFEDRSGLAWFNLLLAPAGGHDDGLGRARAVGREGDDQHRRLRVRQRPGRAPAERRLRGRRSGTDELIPTPPTFLHEFAGSLLEFALMEQALELDQVLLIRSEFAGGRQGLNLNWTLLFIPSRAALDELAASLARLESRESM